jgi:hypothetical protein
VCDGSIFQLIRSLGLLPVLHQGTIVAQVCAALHASVGVYHVINPLFHWKRDVALSYQRDLSVDAEARVGFPVSWKCKGCRRNGLFSSSVFLNTFRCGSAA